MTAIKQLRRYMGMGAAIGRNGAEIVANRNGGLDLAVASGQAALLGGVPISTLLASGDALEYSRGVSFSEAGAAGVYTGSVSVPAGALITDIKVWSTVLWGAGTSALMDVGDGADPDGWYTQINVKATDLLVGEEINFENLGGKAGAYIVAASGLRSAAYSASARTISGVITTVGTASSVGRTFMVVRFVVPSFTAAVKS